MEQNVKVSGETGTAKVPGADTIVVGGGTAGAAMAALLVRASDEDVLLLEAGPDYGPRDSNLWPDDLLDPTTIPASHQWGYDSGDLLPGRKLVYERARVIGGCSAHNGCAMIIGAREDYDGWAASGNLGWSTEELLPFFRAAMRRTRTKRYRVDEITPFQLACMDAAQGIGIPRVEDLNDFDANVGIGPAPVNIYKGTRWNSAFAYLDGVRHQANLRIVGEALVDKLIIDGDRAVGVEWIGGDRRHRVFAERIVLCGGVYGSPPILLRSGIGPADGLRHLGIEPLHHLPGVGRNLQDHPSVALRYEGTDEMRRLSERFAFQRWHPDEQVIAKARSSLCQEAFDLHVYPVSESIPGGWSWEIPVACMETRSRGALTLQSAEPDIGPLIDHGYLSDSEGHDHAVLVDGVALVRDIAAQRPLAKLLGVEVTPGASVRSREDVDRSIVGSYAHYYHPCGTCKMGPTSDPQSVVDSQGRLHALQNVYVADASIMPTVPRGNTNLPTLMIGERIAACLAGVEKPLETA
jgi:choline dehydrogenase